MSLHDGGGFPEVEKSAALLFGLLVSPVASLDDGRTTVPLQHPPADHHAPHDRLEMRDAGLHLAVARTLDERPGVFLAKKEAYHNLSSRFYAR